MTEPDGARQLSAAEIELIVDRAVERAVEKATESTLREVRNVLLALGINVESAKEMQESQKDAAWTRRVRTASETAPGKIGLAVIGALLAAVGGIATYYVKHALDSMWSHTPGA